MTITDKINLAIAICAGLSVLVSAIMVVMTYRILRANRATEQVMREQIEASSRPYVQISPQVRPMTTAVELIVKNVGNSSAENLRLNLDKDFNFNAEDGEHNNLRKYHAFSSEIRMFPPGAELRFLLGIGHQILRKPSLCPLQFSVAASYGFAGKRVLEETTIDLEPFEKSNRPVDPVAERLDQLVSEMKAIRTHFGEKSV